MTSDEYLYRIGDIPTTAYLIKEGKFHISTPFLKQQNFDIQNLLIGTVELFLKKEDNIPNRIFDLAISENAKVSQIPFETILELTSEYKYGYSTNKFLANLIEATNNELHQKRLLMPSEWALLEERATTFVQIIKMIEELCQNTGISEYDRLAKNKKETELYVLGENFKIEDISTQITLENKEIYADTIRINKNETLTKKGDAGDCMYVLLKGSMGVVSGGNYLSGINEHGEAFGELSLFLDGYRTANLIAKEDSSLFIIKKKDLKSFHETHPALFIQIARTLARRFEKNLRNIHIIYSQNSSSERSAHIHQRVKSSGENVKSLVSELHKLKRLSLNHQLLEVIDRVEALPTVKKILNSK